MVALKSVNMRRQYLAVGVLYEILGFVGSYDLKRCALIMCFHNFVVLKIRVITV